MVNLDKYSLIFIANWKLNGNSSFLKDYYEDVSITTMQGVEEKTIFKPLLNFS